MSISHTCIWHNILAKGWGGHGRGSKAGGEEAKQIKGGLKWVSKGRVLICHYCLPLPPFLLPLSSLPFFSARAQGLQFDSQSLPAIVTPDTLHSSRFLLAFENKLCGPALFVVKNEWLKVGMLPRREVKGSVRTSGHSQCLACRHITWKGARLPVLLPAVCVCAARRGLDRSDRETACQVICCKSHYEKHPKLMPDWKSLVY